MDALVSTIKKTTEKVNLLPFLHMITASRGDCLVKGVLQILYMPIIIMFLLFVNLWSQESYGRIVHLWIQASKLAHILRDCSL